MLFRYLTGLALLSLVVVIFAACVSRPHEGKYYYDPPIRYPEPNRDLSSVQDVINRVTLSAFDELYPMYMTESIPLRTINYGMNRVEPALYSYATGSAKMDPTGEATDLWLDSKTDKVQFAIYHFRELNHGDMISSVEITGSPRFGQTRISGIYIGLRQGFDQRYTWHGPYDYYDDWKFELYPPTIHSVGGGYPSMVVAVADGDDLRMTNIWVEVLEVEELTQRRVALKRSSSWPEYSSRPLNYRCNDRTYTTGYYYGPRDSWYAHDSYHYKLNLIEQREYELKLERQRLRDLERELLLNGQTPAQPSPNPVVVPVPSVPEQPVETEPPAPEPVIKSVPVI